MRGGKTASVLEEAENVAQTTSIADLETARSRKLAQIHQNSSEEKVSSPKEEEKEAISKSGKGLKYVPVEAFPFLFATVRIFREIGLTKLRTIWNQLHDKAARKNPELAPATISVKSFIKLCKKLMLTTANPSNMAQTELASIKTLLDPSCSGYISFTRIEEVVHTVSLILHQHEEYRVAFSKGSPAQIGLLCKVFRIFSIMRYMVNAFACLYLKFSS